LSYEGYAFKESGVHKVYNINLSIILIKKDDEIYISNPSIECEGAKIQKDVMDYLPSKYV
jgi:hypothetical protein